MNQLHVKEILEALRGKTILDLVRLCYEAPLLDSTISKLDEVEGVSVEPKNDGSLDFIFKPDFLMYAQWPYFSIIEEAQKVTGLAKELSVYAHQLFDNQNHDFALRFDEKGMTFQNRNNIEDTLFLDLQRYCEHNKINYEVKECGTERME